MIQVKQKKDEKMSHSMMLGTVADALKGIFNKNDATVTYERFKEMKKHVKTDKNLSMTLGLDQ